MIEKTILHFCFSDVDLATVRAACRPLFPPVCCMLQILALLLTCVLMLAALIVAARCLWATYVGKLTVKSGLSWTGTRARALASLGLLVTVGLFVFAAFGFSREYSRLLVDWAKYERMKVIEEKSARVREITSSIRSAKNQTEAENYKSALDIWNHALQLDPDPDQHRQALLGRGLCYYLLGDFASAKRELEGVIELYPTCLQAHRDLAWVLATCNDEGIRDGDAAVASARRAVALARLGEGESSLDFMVLAAAYAERGQFPDAIEAQEYAMWEADDRRTFYGNREWAEELLSLYKNGQPYREDQLKESKTNK